MKDMKDFKNMTMAEKKKYFNDTMDQASKAAERLKNNAQQLMHSVFISAKSKAMLLSVVTDVQYGMALINKYRENDGKVSAQDVSDLYTFMHVIFPETIKKMDCCKEIIDREIVEGVKAELRKGVEDSDNIPDEVFDELVKVILDDAEKAAREMQHKEAEDDVE